ncbi:S8 family serine peptidase [Sinorhizobium medicae]|nr:S8 family serine peptidase [Sinorhizobium medicae]
MTIHRVSVLCVDEGERAQAAGLLLAAPAPETNGDYLIGLVDDTGLSVLTGSGLIFNAEAEPSQQPGVNPAAAAFDAESLEDLADSAKSDRIIIRLAGPFSATVGKALADAGASIERRGASSTYFAERQTGATLQQRISGAVYIARFTGRDLSVITDIPAVDSARWYDVRTTLGDSLAEDVARQLAGVASGRGLKSLGDVVHDIVGSAGEAAFPGGIEPMAADESAAVEDVPYDLRCHDAATVDDVAARVAVIPGVIRVEKGLNRIRYWTARDPVAEAALVATVGALPEVARIEPYVLPEPLLNSVRGSLWGAGPPAGAVKWQGEGELVAITDSGIDESHPDFTGRFEAVYHAGEVSKHDVAGHGTHVASIVAGDGSASGGLLAGIAPKARLFVQCIANSSGGFTGLGVGLRRLMQEAFDKGARIQNFSWGSPVGGRYVLDTLELDEFVAENPEHLVVVAAGNWGAQDIQDPARRIGLMSLGAPANAKNCLAVGACCSPRTDGPYAGKTWAQYSGSQPPHDPPMAELPLTGNADIVASLSSRGPSDEGRVKPDLVAVGVGVAAARSHDYAGAATPWPDKPESYVFMTGTSMAAPVVSGAAAILREYLIKERNHRPSAALLKAILINGARWISNTVQEDAEIGEPNFHQGFGRLDLSRTFPADDAGFALTFIDVGNDDPQAVQMARPTAPAVNWRKRFVVTASDQALSVTICWTDPPERGLQHELDLLVIAPDGTKHVGNSALVRLPTQKNDRTNNVEKIIIGNPEVGEWSVMVTAFNTFRHAQGFAVAATGAITDWIG